MNSALLGHLDALAAACTRRHVVRLSVFGSATGARFRPGESDIDLVVEFQALQPADHADAYFGLIADLEVIFSAEIDLVERSAIVNPYFLQAIEESEVSLFDVA